MNAEAAASERPVRRGLHRFFHVSAHDKYFGGLLAVALVALGVMKVLGICGWVSGLSGVDAIQLGVIFGIFGIVADSYYRMYEARFDA